MRTVLKWFIFSVSICSPLCGAGLSGLSEFDGSLAATDELVINDYDAGNPITRRIDASQLFESFAADPTWSSDFSATDWRTALSLGTASLSASADFATAAQGSLADSALQSGDAVSALSNDSGYLTSSAADAAFVGLSDVGPTLVADAAARKAITAGVVGVTQVLQSDFDGVVWLLVAADESLDSSWLAVPHYADSEGYLRTIQRVDGKTDVAQGDQFLFGDFVGSAGWSQAHSDAALGLANNFHAWWGHGDTRVEFEADVGEMQFYLEGGVGDDAWLGFQESATHEWSIGNDVSSNAFTICTGFGLAPARSVLSIDKSSGLISIAGSFGPSAVADLHRPVDAHKTFLIQEGDNANDAVLQLAALNVGGVGTAILMSNQESSSDGRHWVVQHRGTSDNNRLEIGYKTSVADGENLVGTVSELFGISTVGRVKVTAEGYADDAAAGVGGLASGEIYKTSGHATLPDNVLMIKN